MSSEIMEPEIERVKLSLAEENLLEQIRNYISKLASLLQELETAMNDLFRQKFESAKTRVMKVYEDLKSVYELQSILTRYATKISVSVANGFYYLSLVDSITSLTDSIHKLSLDLELVCTIQLSINETLVISMQSIIKQLKEYTTYIRDIFLYLIENPSKVSGLTTLIEKNFYEVLQTLRTVHIDQGSEIRDPTLINMLTTLTSLMHNLHNLGEKAIWMYVMRTP